MSLRDVLTDREPASSLEVARTIRSTLHEHAVRTDVRPLALLILLGSVEDSRNVVMGSDVTGSQFEADAWGFGEGDMRARDQLKEAWGADLGIRAAQKLVVEIYGELRYEVTILKEKSDSSMVCQSSVT